MAKKLPELSERVSSVDSDIFLINSSNLDYKQTKETFLASERARMDEIEDDVATNGENISDLQTRMGEAETDISTNANAIDSLDSSLAKLSAFNDAPPFRVANAGASKSFKITLSSNNRGTVLFLGNNAQANAVLTLVSWNASLTSSSVVQLASSAAVFETVTFDTTNHTVTINLPDYFTFMAFFAFNGTIRDAEIISR